jgi:hypothetical protein
VFLKTSPNGLHRLFISDHALVVSAPLPDHGSLSGGGTE